MGQVQRAGSRGESDSSLTVAQNMLSGGVWLFDVAGVGIGFVTVSDERPDMGRREGKLQQDVAALLSQV